MPVGETPDPPVEQTRNPVLIELGSRIRARREDLGISQEALAERSALHRTYIPSIEKGFRNVTILALMHLARALETDVHELLAGITLEGPSKGRKKAR